MLDLATLVIIIGAHEIGRRGGVGYVRRLLFGGSDEAKSGADERIEARPAVSPPPAIDGPVRKRLVELGRDGRAFLRPEARKVVERRLSLASLEQLAGPPGVLLYHLVPLGARSALEALNEARARGAEVACSLSCAYARGERVVAVAAGALPESVTMSPHFAALTPAVIVLPAPAPTAAPAPPPKKSRARRPRARGDGSAVVTSDVAQASPVPKSPVNGIAAKAERAAKPVTVESKA